jgi:nitrate/TMAO reductase-like tetraheme cytochrome c subunit
LFLLLTAMASYQSYHFTDSTTFCGKACHTVMKPEMVAYENGAHARVACTECHIGPGAAWFVRAKLSGIYQVYATLTRKYPTPVPTPIENLRPAQETCEQCHWPSAFVGNLDRTYTSFLSDSSNTSYSVRMLLRVGGASPSRGPVGGIHWHMNIANKIEYHATDQKRQQIPWVRVTNPQGVVTEFRAPGFTNDAAELSIRQMDCMDCHNRPAHSINSPNTAVNLAMRLGQLDPNQPNVIDSSLPFIKTNAVFALTRPYTNEIQARNEIATFLASQYPNATRDTKVSRTIEAVQYLYSQNFFPEMKASWRAYPNNIGHKDWPGCFRCHDGKHKSPDGKQIITANDCNACHTILAQGRGEAMAHLDAKGLDFKHPGDEIDKESLCSDCHNGE